MPETHMICEVSHELMTFEECRDCALHRSLQRDPATQKMRHCQYPYPYIAAATEPQHERKGVGISATNIATTCIRSVIWKAQKNYAVYPHEKQPAILGTFHHKGLEQFNEEGILAEVRLAKRLPSGRVITGQIDRYLPEHARIEDYKKKDDDHAVFDKAPLYYVVQLNIYRYMLTTGCVIFHTGEQLPPQEVREMVLYPARHKEWREVYVPIWPLERTEWLIEETLDILDAAEADPDYLPPRAYNDPSTSRFCKDYCPLYSECCAAGGEKRELHVEALTR